MVRLDLSLPLVARPHAPTPSLASCAVTYPLEFIKVQQQLQASVPGQSSVVSSRGGAATATAAAATAAGRPSSSPQVLHIVTNTIEQRGVLGLYSGLSAWLYFRIPMSAIRFTTFEWATGFATGAGYTGPAAGVMCGTLAGVMEWLIFGVPMQCMSTKMLHDTNRATPVYRSFSHAMATIVREEGILKGLWSGTVPNVLKGTRIQSWKLLSN